MLVIYLGILLWILDSKGIYNECLLVEALMEGWIPFKIYVILIKSVMYFSSIKIYNLNFLSHPYNLRSSLCFCSFKISVSIILKEIYYKCLEWWRRELQEIKFRLLKGTLCFRLQKLFPLRYFQFHVLVPLDKELERNKMIQTDCLILRVLIPFHTAWRQNSSA